MVKINKNNQSTCFCRGGSWNYSSYSCKVVCQDDNDVDDRGGSLGFRISRTTKEM
jgi:formylglycine-generating enzyme required for sulfatase activity